MFSLVTSPKWYVLGKQALDDDALAFRKYSLSVIDDQVADPEKAMNIIDFGCQRTNRFSDYMVFHFPSWVSGPPDKSDWKSRMPLEMVDVEKLNQIEAGCTRRIRVEFHISDMSLRF